ncbi:MAG: metal transporter [Solirubrobacterales bacterium]
MIPEMMNIFFNKIAIVHSFYSAVFRYMNEFIDPYLIASEAFTALESDKLQKTDPMQNLFDYMEFMRFNVQIAEKGATGTQKEMEKLMLQEGQRYARAFSNTLAMIPDEEDLVQYYDKLARLMDVLARQNQKTILAVKQDFGFHFERPGYVLAAETPRFCLYQVLPSKPGVELDPNGKPVLIFHPFVLGPNILAFLVDEGKSYVHAFANQGIPTYIRILKDITVTDAVQTMTPEDDALDTQYFCQELIERHGQKVTLNGFCQGGFMAVLDILSGALDGLVDSLITCVAPMDGTRSLALVEYLEHLPTRFRDLSYAYKRMSNGNYVVDGKVMSWVYKLKSMEKEFPLVALFRDMESTDETAMNKTAAALNHWIIYDRNDLPVKITQLSFDSYTQPVTPAGELPVIMFGKRLNFHDFDGKGIDWLLCYAEKDDLVDAPAALTPLDFIKSGIQVTVFPKGHGSIATSWSDENSQCALHKPFQHKGKTYDGPVFWHQKRNRPYYMKKASAQ